MADLQPPDIIPPVTISSADPAPPISAPPAPSSSAPSPPPPPPPPPPPSHLPDIPATIAPPPTVLAPKRQRRPSVRLGEIGHQSFENHSHHPRRPSKTWRFHRDPSLAAKTSKTRPLTNLVNGAAPPAPAPDRTYHHDNTNSYAFDFGTKRTKTKKPPTKRVRSNWASAPKFEAAAPNGGLTLPQNEDCAFRDENQENDDFPDFQPEEGSDSPIKDHSPVHSQDINHNTGLHFWDRRAGVRARRLSRSDSLDPDLDRRDNDLNFDHPFNGIHNDFNSGDHNSSCGVRDWLIGLGLGRYAPVFEIHEVDDEVLPMLTLEDLKDMGINAVGSRRKMFSSIVKLRKRFS
nr:pollen-specific leucine-rich repeat extensin-like protein 1 [Coffea arabica]XP_027099945.1 pollen-specific leucine-rich repeat extensin-like protein 1 [Coffea arabica]XP_027099946.1 pollen-specific leucine-rich repeat extensin-like protein 1 [Coffea arabica]